MRIGKIAPSLESDAQGIVGYATDGMVRGRVEAPR